MRVAAWFLAAFVIAGGLLACSSFSAGMADAGSEASSADADAATPQKDCRGIHGANPSLGDGFYALMLADGGGVTVYCDMTTADGGWTLVGRSVMGADADASFGWTTGHGSADDEGTPYSANAAALGIDFTEILFGTRGDHRTWSTPIYTAPVDHTFLSECADAACPANVTSVDGGCDAPRILMYDGFTSKPNGFYFRDIAEVDVYGLDPYGWTTNGTPTPVCANDALLDRTQGMIFVR